MKELVFVEQYWFIRFIISCAFNEIVFFYTVTPPPFKTLLYMYISGTVSNVSIHECKYGLIFEWNICKQLILKYVTFENTTQCDPPSTKIIRYGSSHYDNNKRKIRNDRVEYSLI